MLSRLSEAGKILACVLDIFLSVRNPAVYSLAQSFSEFITATSVHSAVLSSGAGFVGITGDFTASWPNSEQWT